MSEKNNIEQKIAEIDEILRKIESGEVSLGDISKEYRAAISKISNIEEELESLENEIEILTRDFSKE